MGICLGCCRKSKARFRDKGSKLCSTKHSTVSYSEEIITNPDICLTAGIVSDNTSNKLHKGSMSNMIKGFVSKRRNRYKGDGFNLDLTYITDHIIAMGFPASSIEGVYRNNIDDVVRFLETKHKNHYKIYNLCSERSYDTTKFHNRVEIFPFDDHNPPKIELIKPFCMNVQEWLKSHKDNVAVVHCKAGKGRTGTMICCYLLHSGDFSNAEEALNYYGNKRTQDRKGVTIPSQLRYVHYYAQIMQEHLTYKPEILYIQKIKLEPPPYFAGGQGSVCFAISQQNLKETDGKCCQQCVKLHKSETYEVKRCNVFTIELSVCTPISGDVKVEFYNKKLTKEKQFQFWVNTFFIVKECQDSKNTGDLELVLRKPELDIVNKKDKQNKVFAEDFKVRPLIYLY
ncbi:C2 domain of PTEN tumor-suppressor protein [Popillia japonica]|uniref:Phosphatidylinositol 3,4,5-trisphosphate 3-phosphatase and dual-specificity protein phosphatase PTEN n=1 Tax=Popillia japonica TaxID=7064 RepID=A0AAW1MEX8_POPJA